MGKCYLAWAKDPEIRQKGGSGGFVTATLLAALKEGLVERVLIVRRIDEFEGVPLLTDDPEEVKSCSSAHLAAPLNLSSYIPPGERVAVTVKPCDARAIIERSKRRQIDLEDIYMVGLNCGGTFMPVRTMEAVSDLFGLDPGDVLGFEVSKGKFLVEARSGTYTLPMVELERMGYGRRDPCRYCNINIPVMADLACGDAGVPPGMRATFVEILTDKGDELFEAGIKTSMIEFEEAGEEEIETRVRTDRRMSEDADMWWDELSSMIDEVDHLSYYINELGRCIHCGSCKIVCPVCACKDDAKCLDMGREGYRISLYNLIRLFHLMDSCIGCGQCEDVCPADIPLTMIHQRFERRMEKELGYRPGFEMSKPPLQEPEPGGKV
ncbi:MAG TPA: hypothetical protein ENI32_05065 [Candidatus Syntrophoarchaeum butanivorans]|uniref:Formate dehydrogenase subunit beta n=1 Tax=Candidatus Syntropharchaeum butanivorans TaxID=1839936 RepID=A0A1F2P6G5_9EURY|nr:MAG: formate dehydrogenase subunit beta [Candidatus Syntrophoarchaeum butanivorans]HEC57235.1 hypothetical protein [Candidatus Syntrophoarchaeum butanivorans]